MNGKLRCALAGLTVLGTVLSAQAYDVCVVGGGLSGETWCEVREVPLVRLREQLRASGAIVPDAAK